MAKLSEIIGSKNLRIPYEMRLQFGRVDEFGIESPQDFLFLTWYKKMPDIRVTPLSAGQDVGRYCLLLSMGRKNIMLDCGMQMGYNNERRFPDFSYIVPEGSITNQIDCVIISHFHLDHTRVPFTWRIRQAIAPILLEDMRTVAVVNRIFSPHRWLNIA